MSRRAWMIVAASIVAGAWSVSACAQGVAFAVFNGPYQDAELHRLDLVTGDLTPVGSVGHRVSHIAFDARGVLYGVDSEQDQLITIDTMLGWGTVVGAFGVEISDVRGLAFTDDARLWMAARDDAHGPSLFEVDTATGAATWRFGLVDGDFGSLAGDDDSLLMASYSLAGVDTTTGVTTPLPSSSFGYWSARAIDVDDFGTLWGLMLCGVCMGPTDVLTVRTIDRDTGTVAGDGPYEPHGTWGLAILPGGLFLDGFESGTNSAWSFAP